MADDLRNLWAAQDSGSQFTSPEEIEMKRDQFTRTIRRRNAIEYIVAMLVVVVFSWTAWLVGSQGETLASTGWALGALGAIVVMFGLHSRASVIEDRPEEPCHDHLRSQLVRQQAALEAVPVWYLAPLVPGPVIVMIATIETASRKIGWGPAMLSALPAIGIFVAVFAGVWWLNWRAAKDLGRQIDELDALA